MHRHIFLTGEKGVGKSTIIKRVLTDLEIKNPAGFRTFCERENKDNRDRVYIIPSHRHCEERSDEAIQRKNKKTDHLISIKNKGNKGFEPYPEVFDTAGVEILKKSLTGDNPIILMDELGFLEWDALLFQEEIIKMLDLGLPVIGVIKPRSTPFLDRVRAHNLVDVFEVTEENRDKVYTDVKCRMEEYLAV
jgi:nucleoside-triphosphatase